jgi:hypothetical protein
MSRSNISSRSATTRTELDDVHRSVTQLKNRSRTMQRNQPPFPDPPDNRPNREAARAAITRALVTPA